MKRDQAIELICKQVKNSLSAEERNAIILDWWSIDESDIEFNQIPKQLQKMINDGDPPSIDESRDTLFDSLIYVALCTKFYGIQNKYIEQELRSLGIDDYHVEGTPEKLYPCPCCLFNTLKSPGEFEICPVCFWEDSGHTQPKDYSGPNHMSLAQAQATFKAIDAISLNAKEFVDPEKEIKWIKDI